MSPVRKTRSAIKEENSDIIAERGRNDAGFAMFDAWSRRSAKYDDGFTRKTWIGFRRSPPSRIGAGTIFWLASQHVPQWATWLDDYQPQALAVVQDFLEAME